jgi:hypothetical protein
MRFVLDTHRETVAVDTVASRNGTTITRRRSLDHEAKVLTARYIYLANLEDASV